MKHSSVTTGPLRRPVGHDPVLGALVEKAALELPALCRSVADEIRAQMAMYGEARTVPHDDLEASVEANLRTMIQVLGNPAAIDLDQARATGTRRAEQGAPLPEVLRAFRIGFSALWDLLLAVATDGGQNELRSLVATATSFWFLIDQYLEAVTLAYREATAELVHSQRERRASLLDTLFSGGVVNERAMWDVAQVLGMPHDGVYVVVAAEGSNTGPALLAGCERALDERRIVSVWRSTPSYELAIVSVGSPRRVSGVVEVLASHAKARVGVSPSFVGLENVPRALRLAHVARASVAAGQRWVASFDDSPVSMLVAAAPDEAAQVAHSVLGPVLALPPTERAMLLDTLDCWVRHRGSMKNAAEELHCHPNTVRYRLQRIQTTLNISLSDPGATALVVVGLRAWRLFGTLRTLPLDPSDAPPAGPR